MNSPFPGMDPYLEDPAFWSDFQLTFIGCWREAIADVLPEPYEARLDETVHFVQMPEEVIKLVYPDVTVSRGRKSSRSTPQREFGTTLLKPTIIPHQPLQRVHQGRIEILHRPDRSLVAVLEMLSPTNKVGDGFADYCGKRQAILRKKTHLVELDLLLAGRRLPLSRPLPAGDYFVLISRAEKRPDCEVYAWSLRQPLPGMPIPLRAPDGDVFVDLQAVFGHTYQRGRYARSLRYGRAPFAPLSQKDKRWVMEHKPC
jgi:hypothetical protein